MLRPKDVFTPTGLPSVTLVRDHLDKHIKALRMALETGGYLVSLIGPSKSGKTVFIEDQLGKDNLVHVTGAGINSPEKLWMRVFHLIGTPVEITQTETKSDQLTSTVKGSVEGGIPLVAKGAVETSVAGQKTTTTAEAGKLAIDHLTLLIKELKGSNYTLFIDDFHYIDRAAQPAIAEQIKEAVRQGLTIICAAVPYHSDDVIRSNNDLTGRIMKLDFKYWDGPQLRLIADLGFDALSVHCPADLARSMSEEAAGSPQLMQAICLCACMTASIREAQSVSFSLPDTSSFKSEICEAAVLTTDFSSVLEKMKEGPKTRGTERTSHALKDGKVEDVYPIIVRAIKADPPVLTLRYDDLEARISVLCPNGSPSGSSVLGACAHMAKLANEQANAGLLEWDSANDVLDIRDPYLLFYIRWSDA
jgi:hypothetical protein